MVKVFNFEDNPNEFSANTYIIGKIGASCLVVDIGSTKDEVLEYISSHYESVAGILLTHGHFDHIRGLTKFLRNFKNTPVYLASEDAPLLDNPGINSSNLTGEKVSVNAETIAVEDNETIRLKDFRFKVIKTPFHTMGSVCYLFEDDNALFTGDTLFKGSVGRTDLETSDPSLVEESLRKIYSLDDNLVVYPGHGPITRLEIEKNTNPYLSRMK
jgi:hydroxyacylglutathione hydrolase